MPKTKTVKAILYMGTGNNPKFMKQAEKILKRESIKTRLVRWNTGKKTSIAYGDIDKWNIQSGSFDIGLGHSAGGFPLQKTNATIKIGINPFLTVYPLVNYILHARDDWLVPKDVPKVWHPTNETILYDGGHSTFPTKSLTDLIKKLI